jgi:hypothetical protein
MRRGRALLREVVPVLALLVGSGCYSFAPVSSPAPGMDVRARLRVEAAVRRSQEIDEPIRYVDGRVVTATADEISLDVLIARSQTVFQDIVIRDTITFQLAELEAVLERKLSAKRTGLFVIGTGVGAFLVVKGISQIVGGNEEPPDDDGTTAVVVPAFRQRSFIGLSIPLFRFR